MDNTGLEIAIIGMAGRFPGANTLDEYWRHLLKGEASVSRFSEDELRADGIQAELLRNPNYIKAKPYIPSIYDFDAELFGYTDWEAERMDPQIKLFHECVYHALEDAGYCSDLYPGRIGVYAGASIDINWMRNVMLSQENVDTEVLETGLVCYKDFMSQLVSYKLNLTGPSISLYTACSTSLVAVHLAVQGLLLGDCNAAVAGAVTIIQPNKCGYMYNNGGIHSPTGQCRAFDAKADGTIFGDGGGVVVMKRLSDAIRDQNHIYAVIKSTACNNDGRRKVGFAAPSADGQIEVIRTAFDMGEVDPENITFLEAHGTGTSVGDPIELKALKKAFETDKTSFCVIGSVKANVGHLHAGAGMAGLIKVILSMNHKMIPPAANFDEPNPDLDIENSPFYINKYAIPWEAGREPRTAGISSFGVGGTNMHVIVQEYPEPEEMIPVPSDNAILYLSAKNENALRQATENMIAYLRNNADRNVQDIAHTLIMGRKHYVYKALCVVKDTQDAIDALSDPKRLFSCNPMKKAKPIVFVFSGLGTQYSGMGQGIYKSEPFFREQVNQISARVSPVLGYNVSQIIACQPDGSDARIDEAAVAQPVLFTLAYALTKTLIHYGVNPAFLVDRNGGELIAAVKADTPEALCTLIEKGLIPERIQAFETQLAAVRAADDCIYIEVGPKHPGNDLFNVLTIDNCVISTISEKIDGGNTTWLACMARLEAERIPVNWNNFYSHRPRRRISLPLYPFQRRSYKNFKIFSPLATSAKTNEQIKPSQEKNRDAVFTRPEMDVPYQSPETEVQKIICETAESVLSIDKVGIHDDFYSLGGHSLLFTKIVTQLNQIFQADIPLDAVFDNPTAAFIETMLRKQRPDAGMLDEIASAYREYQKTEMDGVL